MCNKKLKTFNFFFGFKIMKIGSSNFHQTADPYHHLGKRHPILPLLKLALHATSRRSVMRSSFLRLKAVFNSVITFTALHLRFFTDRLKHYRYVSTVPARNHENSCKLSRARRRSRASPFQRRPFVYSSGFATHNAPISIQENPT